ncbi:hypothetical protein PM082_015193 [Marasmius tenuissimus]|nr:hypothetical protein PM082_015193 [Marasmius tenuissimus]
MKTRRETIDFHRFSFDFLQLDRPKDRLHLRILVDRWSLGDGCFTSLTRQHSTPLVNGKCTYFDPIALLIIPFGNSYHPPFDTSPLRSRGENDDCLLWASGDTSTREGSGLDKRQLCTLASTLSTTRTRYIAFGILRPSEATRRGEGYSGGES